MLKEDYKIDITGRQFYEESADTGPGEITLRTTGTYTERGARAYRLVRI